MNFNQLPELINLLQETAQNRALQSVNRMLTIGNWLIGYYIVEYEQNGEDRAEYASSLLSSLAKELKYKKLKGMSYSNLKLYRQFFLSYPQILQTVSEEFTLITGIDQLSDNQIRQTVSGELGKPIINNALRPSDDFNIHQTASGESEKGQTVSGELPPEILLKHFSFSHFIELMRIDKKQVREFYEIEAINGS
jgi:hypothetical protein